mmetsp:Transcript_63612/g.151775  ORF Transcript_63612/g.151775 Transcript_63612/m.151775 type:complete len:427 (-) Transcript_63612:83-1363(-)
MGFTTAPIRMCGSPKAQRSTQTVPKHAAGKKTIALRSRTREARLGNRTNRKRIEVRLYELLKMLAAHERRALLTTEFSQAQRLALERWFLSEARKPTSAAAASPVEQEQQQKQLQQDSATAPPRRPHTCRRRKALSPPEAAQEDSAEDAPSSAAEEKCGGIHTHRRPDTVIHKANVWLGPFRITSRSSADITKAKADLQVLLGMRRQFDELLTSQHIIGIAAKVENCAERHVQVIEMCLRTVVLEVFTQRDVTKLGLRCYASVPAGCWVGRALQTPSHPLFQGWEKMLQEWRRLHLARAMVAPAGIGMHHQALQSYCSSEELLQVWTRLRKAHIQNWVDKDGSMEHKVTARLDELYRQHSERSKIRAPPRGKQLQYTSPLCADAAPPPTPSVKCTVDRAESVMRPGCDGKCAVHRQIAALLMRWRP